MTGKGQLRGGEGKTTKDPSGELIGDHEFRNRVVDKDLFGFGSVPGCTRVRLPSENVLHSGEG